MYSWLKTAALAAVACGAFAFVNTPAAQAQRVVYRSYYAGPYYAGSTVTYRRPLTPFYAPRTAYYAPAPVYAAPVYGVPGYAAPVYGAPAYGYAAPTVTNYPGAPVYYPAPLPVPAVVYPLPSAVYPPAVFP